MIPLRPNYTLYLLKELQKQSLNIYGDREQGQFRLLDDIRVLAKAQSSIVFLLDMKSYADNYKAFIKEIRKQLYVYVPEAKDENVNNLLQAVTAIDELTVNRRAMFLLHDFDALFNNPLLDYHYDSHFFDMINALAERGVRFLCITRQPHSQCKIYFFKQKEQRNSWLILKEVALPALTVKEIADELGQNNLSVFDKQLSFLIAMVKQHSHSYLLLNFFITKLKTNAPVKTKFKTQLKKWREEFDKREKIPWYKRQYYVKDIIRSLRLRWKKLWLNSNANS